MSFRIINTHTVSIPIVSRTGQLKVVPAGEKDALNFDFGNPTVWPDVALDGGWSIPACSPVVADLPPPQENVLYLVPEHVLAFSRRADFVAPGSPIKDKQGRLIGYLGFIRLPKPAATVRPEER